MSLPLLESKERTWDMLQQKTTYDNNWAVNFKFDIPELRVGTLDSLMQLSDDLVKTNISLEAVVGKIRRTIVDVCGSPAAACAIDGIPVDSYLTGFQWDEAKYPSRRSLQETVVKIQEDMVKLDDDLKVWPAAPAPLFMPHYSWSAKLGQQRQPHGTGHKGSGFQPFTLTSSENQDQAKPSNPPCNLPICRYVQH